MGGSTRLGSGAERKGAAKAEEVGTFKMISRSILLDFR